MKAKVCNKLKYVANLYLYNDFQNREDRIGKWKFLILIQYSQKSKEEMKSVSVAASANKLFTDSLDNLFSLPVVQ